MTTKSSLRKNWIDTAKVIAIFVVVLNHSGLHITGVNFWGGMFYVPAFFLLAGFTYQGRKESYSSFVKRKARRLLVPYLIANVLLVAFFTLLDMMKHTLDVNQLLLSVVGIFYGRNQIFAGEIPVFFGHEISTVGGSAHEPIYLMTSLNAPTWFLPALFLLLVAMELLHRVTKDNAKAIATVILIGLVLSIGYHYFVPVLLPWSLENLPIMAMLFEIGHLYAKTDIYALLGQKKWYIRALIFGGDGIVLILAGLLNGSANMSISMFGKSVILFLVTALASTELLLQVMYLLDEKCAKLSAWIARLSKHTLTILCYHYFVLQMSLSVLAALCGSVFGDGKATVVVTVVSQLIAIFISIVACVLLDGLLRIAQKKA